MLGMFAPSVVYDEPPSGTRSLSEKLLDHGAPMSGQFRGFEPSYVHAPAGNVRPLPPVTVYPVHPMQLETGPAEQFAFGDRSAGVLPLGHTSFQQLLPEHSTAGGLVD